tara:strand:- start:66 stop:347 length:282 start_codon:yes stop_codon:yes gene_type:complete
MNMFYGDIEYTLVTDPLEAMYWSTYKLKKRDVKILTKASRTEAAKLRQEILDDIIQQEVSASTDKIQERSQARVGKYVKTRQTKQKARGQSKR